MGLLQVLLWVCVAYFVAMAAAHWTDFKVPFLFIYYDVPSMAYQNKIISFCCLTYVSLFATAAMYPPAVPAALASLATTVLGLTAVTSSDALISAMGKGSSTSMYRTQTAAIGGLLLVLTGLYLISTPSTGARGGKTPARRA